FVTRGLRARMVTANILAGTLYVELVEVADALPAIMNLTSGDFPVIPTTASDISDVAATAEGLLARINALPVEELMDGAIDMMDSFERLANDEYTRAAPAALVTLLDESRELINSDDIQAIPRDLRDVIGDLDGLISEASETGLIADFDAAIETAAQVATNIEVATQNLPQITANIEELTARANALELEALVASATESLNAIDAFLGTEDAVAFPGEANAALATMRALLDDVREGGAVANVNAALASANEAARAIEEAVGTLPGLAARANQLVVQTEAVVNSYSERSRFSAETLATLRDIQEASDAISSLARAIERNPNSLLIGR
ncbi:MAG: paraquat-inducible protein B, partial [Pseudomonadota bacterium]